MIAVVCMAHNGVLLLLFLIQKGRYKVGSCFSNNTMTYQLVNCVEHLGCQHNIVANTFFLVGKLTDTSRKP